MALRDWLEERAADVNMWDGGKTGKTVRQARQSQPAATVKKQPVVNRQPSPVRQVQNFGNTVAAGFKTGMPTFKLAADRTLTGLGQDVSGAVDLISPGTGTNRVSKALDTRAKAIDQVARDRNVESTYRAAQVPLNVAAFAAPGIGQAPAAAMVAAKAPRLVTATTRLAQPVNKVVDNVAGKLAQQGAGGRIAAAGVRGAATAPMVTNTAVGTVMDLGGESGKGRDISPTDVAISAAANTGMAAGLPMGAQAVRETVRAVGPTTRLVSNVTRNAFVDTANAVTGKVAQAKENRRVYSFTPEDEAAIADISNMKAGDYANDTRTINILNRKAKELEQKYKIDLTTGSRQEQYLRAGRYIERAAEQRAKAQGKGPRLNQGGYVQIPGVKGEANYRKQLDIIQKELDKTTDPKVRNNLIIKQDKLIARMDTDAPTGIGKVGSLAQKAIDRAKEMNKNMGEGGYVKIPGGAKDPAPDLSSAQKEAINEYAKFIESQGGNDVTVLPDGRRVSNNGPDYSRLYAEKGRKPTQAEFFDEARKQLETGKADEYAVTEYKNIRSDAPLQVPEGFEDIGTPTAAPKVPVTPKPKKIPTTPKKQLTGAVEQPQGKESRFANTTVQNSDEVSDATKQLVKDKKVTYDPTTNEGRLKEAETRLSQGSDDDNFAKVLADLDDTATKTNGQSEVTAITLAKQLDSKGDETSLAKSTEIYERLSERLSKSSQEVQAASLLANRTPEGLQYGAIRDLKKNGIEATPERQKAIKDLTQKVRDAGDDVNAANLARYQLAKYVSQQIPRGAADKLVNLWRAGLLTAPTTTGGNILGNSGEAAVRKLWVNPLASAVDMGFGVFTGKRTQTLSPAGGFTKGAKDGAGRLEQFMKTGYDERNALSKYDTSELNYGSSPVGKLLGGYVNGVYRTMSLADQPFWYGARGEALGSIAKAEAVNKGLKGDKQRAFIQSFMDNPPKAAMERATREAKYATFQNKTALGEAAGSLKQGLRRHSSAAGAAADFFVPFTQVPASIATRIVTRTPIGTAQEAVKQFVTVKKGGTFDQRAMSQAIAEGSFGPAVFSAGYALANSGLLTFGFPEDRKERELWEAEGKQPYSVRVGDRWYSLNYLQPFGTLLSVGGEAANAVKDGASPAATVSRGIATAGQAVMNQSFLKGISGVLDAIDDPKRYSENYVSNTAGSVVPNFVRSFARATDPLQRESGDVTTGLKQAIPGLRETTNEKLDMFGGAVPAKDTFANQYLNPLRPSKVRGEDDVVAKELRRLKDIDEGVLPTAATKSTFKDTKLTDDQVREINKLAGPALKTEYQKLVSSEAYTALSDEDKAGALKKVNSTVFGGLKAMYGLNNGVITEAKLTKNQKKYLSGQSVDYLSSKETTVTQKKARTGGKRGGTRSAGRSRTTDFSLYSGKDFSPTAGSRRLSQLLKEARLTKSSSRA